MIKIFPLIFILLWSSAFITTKPIIDNSDPFAALAFRFALVTLGFFMFSIYSKEKIWVSRKSFQDFSFSPNGLYIYTIDLNQDYIYIYSTSVPFVLESSAATITFINSIYIGNFENAPRSIHIAGSNIYITGTTSDDVWYAPIPF